MTCLPAHRPGFINWPVEVDIGINGKEYMTESITELISGREKSPFDAYPLLMQRMTKR